MKLCLLNLLILIGFLCNSFSGVLFESLSHMINQESHLLVKFGENLPRSFFQKSELGKFIPNFPLKHVITSTNVIYLFQVRSFAT